MNDPAAKVRALYSVREAMALLNLSRTQIYELIRTSRLVTVTQGRRRLVPADSITDYVQLLLERRRPPLERSASALGWPSLSGLQRRRQATNRHRQREHQDRSQDQAASASARS
jgi:excisionase family DNA binding protein